MGRPHSAETNDLAYIDSAEALRILGIRRASFYTYVSRGLVKTKATPGRRTKLYRKADVERLKTLAARRGGTRVAHSLRYGEPIVQTWVSEVTPEGPTYRGQLATDLVRAGRSFEYASELLWHGPLHARGEPWSAVALPAQFVRGMPKSEWSGDSIALLSSCVEALQRANAVEANASGDPRDTCIRVLQAVAGCAGLLGAGRAFVPARGVETVASHAMRALSGRTDREELAIVDALLVLSADNELTPPTFCARICASTGADLIACVACALMTHSGPMQVGGAFAFETVLDAVCQRRAVRRARRPPADIPCFGHPLYDKDPRGALLIERVKRLDRRVPEADAVLSFVDDAASRGLHPNIFAAAVVVCRCLGLPAGSGAYLQTLGRAAGWMAHAMEQRLVGSMLRPRARYMGSKGDRANER